MMINITTNFCNKNTVPNTAINKRIYLAASGMIYFIFLLLLYAVARLRPGKQTSVGRPIT